MLKLGPLNQFTTTTGCASEQGLLLKMHFFSEMSLRAHITMKFEVLSDNLLKKMGVKKYYDEFCIRTTS